MHFRELLFSLTLLILSKYSFIFCLPNACFKKMLLLENIYHISVLSWFAVSVDSDVYKMSVTLCAAPVPDKAYAGQTGGCQRACCSQDQCKWLFLLSPLAPSTKSC